MIKKIFETFLRLLKQVDLTLPRTSLLYNDLLQTYLHFSSYKTRRKIEPESGTVPIKYRFGNVIALFP